MNFLTMPLPDHPSYAMPFSVNHGRHPRMVQRVRMIPAAMSFWIFWRTIGFFMWSWSAAGSPCACCRIYIRTSRQR